MLGQSLGDTWMDHPAGSAYPAGIATRASGSVVPVCGCGLHMPSPVKRAMKIVVRLMVGMIMTGKEWNGLGSWGLSLNKGGRELECKLAELEWL